MVNRWSTWRPRITRPSLARCSPTVSSTSSNSRRPRHLSSCSSSQESHNSPKYRMATLRTCLPLRRSFSRTMMSSRTRRQRLMIKMINNNNRRYKRRRIMMTQQWQTPSKSYITRPTIRQMSSTCTRNRRSTSSRSTTRHSQVSSES